MLDAHFDEVGESERGIEQLDGFFGALGMQRNDRTPECVLWAEFAEDLASAVLTQIGILVQEIELPFEDRGRRTEKGSNPARGCLWSGMVWCRRHVKVPDCDGAQVRRF